MLPPPRPPDPNRSAYASIMDDSAMIEDTENPSPQRPTTDPPSSGLHILLRKLLGEDARRDASGAVSLDAQFVQMILELSATNERMILRLENTIDQLNAKLDPLIVQMAEFQKFMQSGKPTAPQAKKSFASVASINHPTVVNAPTTRPPPAQALASLKPKRVIIHSNPANTTLKDVPRCALVQKANDALLKLEARVDGENVAVRGVSMLPSGDVSFYTKNRFHQKWLMENKHLWSKEVHIDLESTPSTFSVMAHGVPKTFDIGKAANISQLASENNFQATDLARVRWMGSNEPSAKKAGSIILSFTNKDLAFRVEKSGAVGKPL
ncbi:hypothetical protein, variant [Puccinia graminis f. sp. tritici CRL 75-36-700-3]|uniref:Uncharacterized protein n=1 Tax=Puccinia graminis f. sp. tritici (strain CRL 75-36-700-3 / race SCCL) TaxID=418459 RepID=H6QPZ9_PUCGT|nr:hypothetical protein, variant [Puccinia graminis f. sp. tritici CRL 75-36-700-3]EHS64522.1 hypothetical protein, variant [Puccinia graminis f. sp. tritici CRL 75-36-700-3]